MLLSSGLLELLNALDRAELNVPYLLGHLDDVVGDNPPYSTSEEQRDAEDTTIEVQRLVEMIVPAKQEPTFTIDRVTIGCMREMVNENISTNILRSKRSFAFLM